MATKKLTELPGPTPGTRKPASKVGRNTGLLEPPDTLAANGAQSGSPHDGERYIVPALRRGLAMLRLFTTERRVISVPEMVRELGISRASAFRLAHTLEADGYLQRTPHSSAFQLGLNVLSLGFEYLGSLGLIEIGQPILEDLRDRMDASAHMGMRDGTDVVYILSASSRHRLRNHVPVGTRMPAHATSIGYALLFDASMQELHKLYDGVEMRRFSRQTPITIAALYKKLQEERKRGYVSYRSAFSQGIASVAAPVRDQSGSIVAGINISDYESLNIMQEQDGRLKDEVLRAAAAISYDLGYREG
jgi:DNA-binding IclR family transcriptional regulator